MSSVFSAKRRGGQGARNNKDCDDLLRSAQSIVQEARPGMISSRKAARIAKKTKVFYVALLAAWRESCSSLAHCPFKDCTTCLKLSTLASRFTPISLAYVLPSGEDMRSSMKLILYMNIIFPAPFLECSFTLSFSNSYQSEAVGDGIAHSDQPALTNGCEMFFTLRSHLKSRLWRDSRMKQAGIYFPRS